MSDVIPPEIVSNILSRLPVKQLLRFRCVSSSLKATIDSPSFIKAHLSRQLLKPNSDVKLLLRSYTLFSIDLCSVGCSQAQEVEHPLKVPACPTSGCPTSILGSCHGLILISNSLDDNGVWNPSTKMFRKLPPCVLEPPQRKAVVKPPHGKVGGMAQYCGGFGYDMVSDDYKVVKIGQWFHFSDRSIVSQIMIFSLKLGVWREVDDCLYWFINENDGTLAGGALNWIASEDPSGPWILVGLHLGNEKVHQIPFPENFAMPFQLNLAVLAESLCLLSGHVTNPNNPIIDHIDIWAMKDYGVKESWIKLFSVEQLDGRQQFSILRPIAYSMTGEEVLMEMDSKKFLWYSIEKKSLKNAKISGVLDPFTTSICLATLVKLHG